MDPAAGNFEILPFFFELMVDLIPIGHYSSGESFQKLPWMICTAGLLPIVEHDRMSTFKRPIPIDPHISLFAVFDFGIVDTHDLYWSLAGMDDFTVIDQFMHTIIN